MSSEQITLLVIGALLGLFEEVRIVDLIKSRLGWEGTQAKLLAAAVSVLVSLAGLFVSGEIGLADFTLANLPYVFAPVYALAELVYFFRKA